MCDPDLCSLTWGEDGPPVHCCALCRTDHPARPRDTAGKLLAKLGPVAPDPGLLKRLLAICRDEEINRSSLN